MRGTFYMVTLPYYNGEYRQIVEYTYNEKEAKEILRRWERKGYKDVQYVKKKGKYPLEMLHSRPREYDEIPIPLPENRR